MHIVVDSLDISFHFFLGRLWFSIGDTGMIRCDVCDYFDIASICARSRAIITQCGWFKKNEMIRIHYCWNHAKETNTIDSLHHGLVEVSLRIREFKDEISVEGEESVSMNDNAANCTNSSPSMCARGQGLARTRAHASYNVECRKRRAEGMGTRD